MPSSARIRHGTPNSHAVSVSAALGPDSHPSALGFGWVWNVATRTPPGTTGGVLKSKVVCPGARSASRVIHVDPATLFVPQSRVPRKRIIPGLLESLLHQQIVHEIHGCWCLHSPYRLPTIPESDPLSISLPQTAANFKRPPDHGRRPLWRGWTLLH